MKTFKQYIREAVEDDLSNEKSDDASSVDLSVVDAKFLVKDIKFGTRVNNKIEASIPRAFITGGESLGANVTVRGTGKFTDTSDFASEFGSNLAWIGQNFEDGFWVPLSSLMKA